MADILTTDNGNVEIAPDALLKIVSLSLADIEGLTPLKNAKKQIKIDFSEDALSIWLTVCIQYGYRIPDVCDTIRSNISTALKDLSGLTASTININVSDIDIKNATTTTAQ